jgi:hypothetical protein
VLGLADDGERSGPGRTYPRDWVGEQPVERVSGWLAPYVLFCPVLKTDVGRCTRVLPAAAAGGATSVY